MTAGPISLSRGRQYIVIAALLWSLSGVLAKTIALPGPTMACLRALFAGLVLLPLLKSQAVRFRPAMLGMVACFATMNVCFVTAITVTSAANAIFLQYTAPAWMVLASVWWLHEPVDRRSLQCLAVGMVGVLIILVGSWKQASWGLVLGLIAGVSYAGVVVFLRVLNQENPIWLTLVNHLASGLLLLPVLLIVSEMSPFRATLGQLAAMAAFGVVQMALPYILFSRGLTVISVQEAGLIALLEPVLNPLWTWMVVGEVPAASTLVGGGIILAGVAWRYWARSE